MEENWGKSIDYKERKKLYSDKLFLFLVVSVIEISASCKELILQRITHRNDLNDIEFEWIIYHPAVCL